MVCAIIEAPLTNVTTTECHYPGLTSKENGTTERLHIRKDSIMRRIKFVVKPNELLMFIAIAIFIFRDFAKVFLGHVEIDGIKYSFVPYTASSIYLAELVAVFLFSLSLITTPKKPLPKRAVYEMGTVVLLTLFWTAHSFFTRSGYSLTTMESTSKTICIAMFAILIGYNETFWNWFKKYIPIMALLYLSATFGWVIYSYMKGMISLYSNQSPYWMLYSTAFWLFSYCLLCWEENKTTSNAIILIMMILNITIVAFTISRGWLIQTIVLYIIFFYTNKQVGRRNKRRLAVLFFLLMAFGIYMIRDDLLKAIISYITKFETSQSRSTQYHDFFSQVTVFDLLIGKGEYAYYSYKNNPYYLYIDNSYLYYSFHFGIIFSAIMFIMPIREALKSLKQKARSQEANIGYILLLWVAALLGVSVFCAGYEIGLRMIFIFTLIGRIMHVQTIQPSDFPVEYYSKTA